MRVPRGLINDIEIIRFAGQDAVVTGSTRGLGYAIAPGLIATSFADGLMGDDAFMARRMKMTPLRRVGQPSEIAGAAVFVAAPAGGFAMVK